MGFLDRFRGRKHGVATKTPPVREVDPAEWSVLRVENAETGEVAVMRARFSRPRRHDIAALRTAIVIKWPYDEKHRMPPPDVNADHLRFERALEPLDTSEISELVHVSTGMGLKEWIYYASGSDIFMARFNDLLSGQSAYPLEIEFYEDPDWSVWSDMVDPLRARAGS